MTIDPIASLIDDLIGAIEASGPALAWDDALFARWATRLAEAQAAAGAPGLRRPPRALPRLELLAPITTDVFRYAEVRSWREGEAAVVFQTSGTLARFRGRHALQRVDLYECSAVAAFDALIGRRVELGGLISLVPPFSQLGDSSLAFMLSLLARRRFSDRTVWAVGPDGLDADRLRVGFERLQAAQAPLLLFTTTLAAVELLALELGALDLPPGSLILTTGGAKTQGQDLVGEDVDRLLAERFTGATVGAEYGMTELLSQAYRIGPEPFRLPAWCRVLAVDPATGDRQPHGRTGLLRFVDLANVQSAIAVQTADLGATHSDHTFTLFGRAQDAPLRGCSLSYEELVGGGLGD